MTEGSKGTSPSVERIVAKLETVLPCPNRTRRALLLSALATGACLATASAAADDDAPGSDERPQKGDLLVISEGDHAGEIIKPGDLKPGGPLLRAWPRDPKTSVTRNGC